MLIILLSFSTEKFISTSQFIIDSTRKISLTSRQLQVYRMHNIMMKWIQVELLKCTLDFTIWICSEFLYTLRILFHLNPYSVATKFGKKSDNNFDNFILKRPIFVPFLRMLWKSVPLLIIIIPFEFIDELLHSMMDRFEWWEQMKIIALSLLTN